jgi:spermidine synthase
VSLKVEHQPDGNSGRILKFALLATGCAGVVAEYVLSTLATYILGNAVLQWTVVISLMLFAMGIGSRISRHLLGNLLDKFIVIELTLSLLCGGSVALCYSLYGRINSIGLMVYVLSFGVGLLIGLEIPLATRINNTYEELRVNISSVLEYDYFGALIGGIFFIFFGLPRLGLSYTPIVLAGVNLLVASLLAVRFRRSLVFPYQIFSSILLVASGLALLAAFSKPIVLYGEQRLYKDKIIYSTQTRYQKIVVTQWKEHYWLFINGNAQFSSFDEERYHEPLVHPAMSLSVPHERILILGGGDGLALREILKYTDVGSVTLVDLDPGMTDLGRYHPVFVKLNRDSLQDPRVTVVNQDAAAYLADCRDLYNIVFIDLPDPNSIELSRLYTLEFYQLCRRNLAKGGILVTQATSPLFSAEAFNCILRTMRAAGLSVVPFHNQIPTMGEWGWLLGVDATLIQEDALRKAVTGLSFDHVETRFLNAPAMVSMLNFGKGIFDSYDEIKVNTGSHPVLVGYYRAGRWDMY